MLTDRDFRKLSDLPDLRKGGQVLNTLDKIYNLARVGLCYSFRVDLQSALYTATQILFLILFILSIPHLCVRDRVTNFIFNGKPCF